MNNPFRDNGGYIPGLALITNNLGRPEHMVRRKKKRRPIVKVRRGMTYYRDGYGYMWNWTCRLCYHRSGAAYWDLAYDSATHHAHNHH